MNAPDRTPIRLTQFSQGGGCSRKLAPGLVGMPIDSLPGAAIRRMRDEGFASAAVIGQMASGPSRAGVH